MSFVAEQEQENNLEKYKSLVRQAQNIISQCNAWQSEYNALRASVTADKQAELDTKKAQFTSAVATALGV